MVHQIILRAFNQDSQLLLVVGESGVGKSYTISEALAEATAQKKTKNQSFVLHHFCRNTLSTSMDMSSFRSAVELKPVGKQNCHIVVVLDNCDHFADNIRTSLDKWLQKRQKKNNEANLRSPTGVGNLWRHNSIIFVADTTHDATVHRWKKQFIPSTCIVKLSPPSEFVKVEFLRKRLPYVAETELTKMASNCYQYHMLLRMVEVFEKANHQVADNNNTTTDTIIIPEEVLRKMNVSERARFTAQNTKKHNQTPQREAILAKQNREIMLMNVDNPDRAANRESLFHAVYEVQKQVRFRHPFSSPVFSHSTEHVLDHFFMHDRKQMTEMLHFQLPFNLANFQHDHDKKTIDEDNVKKCNHCALECDQMIKLSECIDAFSLRDLCSFEQTDIARTFVDVAIALIPRPTQATYSIETFKSTNAINNSRTNQQQHGNNNAEDSKSHYDEKSIKMRHCYESMSLTNNRLMTSMEWLEILWTSYFCDDGKPRSLLLWEIFPRGFLSWDEDHRTKHNENIVRLLFPPFIARESEEKEQPKKQLGAQTTDSTVVKYDRKQAAKKRLLLTNVVTTASTILPTTPILTNPAYDRKSAAKKRSLQTFLSPTMSIEKNKLSTQKIK